VRRTHEDRILAVLRDHGSLSRAEIAPLVGLSRTTLSEITNVLIERGAVIVTETDALSRVGRGRPAARLALDPQAGQFLGADFAHERVYIAVADASHEIIAAGSAGYRPDSPWQERVNAAFGVLDDLEAATGVHYGALQSAGVGLPTPVVHGQRDDAARPAPTAGERIVGLIEEAFLERFDAPVIIDNNTQFAALAEAEWAGADSTADLVFLRLSHGCGGGLVVGGQLIAGHSGFAGEIGHITVDPDGAPCRCGKQGCLETVASLPAVIEACGDPGGRDLHGVALAAAAQDAHVLAVLGRVGEQIGRVLAAVATTLAPSDVVVAGPVVTLHPVVLERAAEAFRAEVLSVPGYVPTFRPASLGDGAGALGALVAAFHNSPLLVTYPATVRRGNPRATTRQRSLR